MSKSFLLFLILYALFWWNACALSPETYKHGKSLYVQQCAPCHGESLQGLGKLYPSIKNPSDFKYTQESIICLIAKGSTNPSDSMGTNGELIVLNMPAFPKLSAIEINNILNYLNETHWKGKPYQLDQTEKILSDCKEIIKSGTPQQ